MAYIRRRVHAVALLLVVGLLTLGAALAGCAPAAAPPAAPTKAAAQPAAPAAAKADDQQVVEIKGGTTDPLNSPVHQMMDKYTKLIADRTNNKIKMSFFPAGQLGGESDVVQGLQLGTVGYTIVGVTGHKVWDALTLPYLFRDRQHMWSVLRGPIGQDWGNQMLKDKGLRVLGYAYRSPRNLTTSKTKVSSVADMKGLKIRLSEIPVMVAGFKAMGANPTPMAWPEVITALQQGTIDGQENPVETLVSNKIWEVQKFMSRTAHTIYPWTLLMDDKVWQKITPANQKILLDTFTEVGNEMEQQLVTKETENIQLLKTNGMTVVEPPELNVQSFRDATKDVYKDFTPKAWGDGVYEKIQETK